MNKKSAIIVRGWGNKRYVLIQREHNRGEYKPGYYSRIRLQNYLNYVCKVRPDIVMFPSGDLSVVYEFGEDKNG